VLLVRLAAEPGSDNRGSSLAESDVFVSGTKNFSVN